MVEKSWFEQEVEEHPEYLNFANIEQWEYLGDTGSQFLYGELSTFCLSYWNKETQCSNYIWFKFHGDVSQMLKTYRWYDSPSSEVHRILQACLYIACNRSDKYHKDLENAK